MLIRQMQLGKQGITENFINGLKNLPETGEKL